MEESDAGILCVAEGKALRRTVYDGGSREFYDSCYRLRLRERVTGKTADVRDLLLATAFSASGVLEDSPQGFVR